MSVDLEKEHISSAKTLSYLLHQKRLPQKSEKDVTLIKNLEIKLFKYIDQIK